MFDEHTNKLEESTAESILFGPRGTEARYCVKQSGVKTHRSIPRCFPTVRLLWEKSITVGYEVVLARSLDLSISAAATAL